MLNMSRRLKTLLTQASRKGLLIVNLLMWLLLDGAKFTIIRRNKIKKLLFVLINQERGNVGGDFVSLGVLNDFKRQYPKVQVSLLSDKQTLKQFGGLQKVEEIEFKGKETLKKLKEKKFDAVILQSDGGRLQVSDLKFIPYRIGRTRYNYRKFLKKENFGFTRKSYRLISKPMAVGRYEMFGELGYKFKEMKPFLYLTKKQEQKTDKFLKKNKIKNYVVIHPGGKFVVESLKKEKWAPHLWNLDRYAEVADHFSNKGYKVVVTGTKDEDLLFKEIKKRMRNKNKIVSACGLLSIREGAVLLKKSSLLIATDTAMVHIAYQGPVNAKIVELMGPSVPKSVGAWPMNDKRHRILIDKGPYYKSLRKLPLPNNYNCLKEISTEQVIRAGEALLKVK
tara:strand:- start:5681 stop:6859 length:1179 start_codon:yes stop_codon:yes gene_type:complete